MGTSKRKAELKPTKAITPTCVVERSRLSIKEEMAALKLITLFLKSSELMVKT